MPYQEQDIIGRKFAKLTVIKRSITARISGELCYECLCECGREANCTAYQLVKGKRVSCGCWQHPKSHKRKDLTGQTFGRLTVLGVDPQYSERIVVKCDCGEVKTVIYYNLMDGNTNSCGCLERSKNPQLASAKLVWRGDYKDGDLSLDDFLILSQKNCYYCNDTPKNLRNIAKQNSANYCEISKNNKDYDFIYNGLDRIDSSMPHNKNNVVTSCITCNWMKNNLSYNDFMNKIISIYTNFIVSNKIYLINNNFIEIINYYLSSTFNLDSKYLGSAKTVFRSCKRNPGNLSFENFLRIGQYNCFYCNIPPSNNRQGFIYSGLDRINNNEGYNLLNIVPCCKQCNIMKSNFTIEDFQNNVNNIAKFHINSAILANPLIIDQHPLISPTYPKGIS